MVTFPSVCPKHERISLWHLPQDPNRTSESKIHQSVDLPGKIGLLNYTYQARLHSTNKNSLITILKLLPVASAPRFWFLYSPASSVFRFGVVRQFAQWLAFCSHSKKNCWFHVQLFSYSAVLNENGNFQVLYKLKWKMDNYFILIFYINVSH